MKSFFDKTTRRLFSHQVLNDIKDKRFKKLDTTYPSLRSDQKEQRIQKLTETLPSGPDILYRGTEGVSEIQAIMKTERLGRKLETSKKSRSLDIVGYIRDNDSKYFLSFSPCKETVKPYAAGLSIVPCRGYIMVTGLPKVYTIPQKLLYLNEAMFKRYDEFMIGQADQDNPQAYQSIVTMTRNNNEVTAIIGATENDDWRPVVQDDVISIIEVCGPGRILSTFMAASEPAFVRHWENIDYKKRIYAIETVFHGGPAYPHELEQMNEKAQAMGLIAPEHRLITLADAEVVINSGELDKLNDRYDATETQRLITVPKEIPMGHKDGLIEYMVSTLVSSNSLTEKETPKGSVLE
ncbi:hypothetical protein ELY21_05745 [Legionella sp. km535]|uniref:hypothetical protein n=1 Tax=Legionella sp. km535 TaxID=2498107 RepID=UPI000F8F4EF2|nr:hypothetical protein [Legionella sp. km535]RUR19027.1 hypothetical protein ELY21_05745 [Legionella sp. km535]